MNWLRRMFGGAQAPEGFDGALDAEERVLASAVVATGGHVVLTPLGLWLPRDPAAPGATPDSEATDDTAGGAVPAGGRHRRIGWHLVSKATWDGRALTVIEAEEIGTDGDAVLIADLPPLRLPLPTPGTVPEVVHARVTKSVLHSEQAPGGGLLVQRRVPGRDGVQVQIRRPR